MIQVISKFLILTLTLTTFGVNPSIAEETKDKKIQQLETLLEIYIEENRELKQRLEKIESVQQNSISSDTATTPKQPIEHNSAKLTCEQNLELCDRVELCKIATYKVNGAKKWKVGSYQKFVDEAKRRNITCEVDGGIKTARSLCEENLTACDATLLCKMSTHMSRYYENGKLIDNRAWFKTPEHRKFIEEAKSRNLSCGVVDLKAKAERDQQEAEKAAKLKAEAKAERDRQEAEAKRKETEKARQEAEAEAKRKETEKARLKAERDRQEAEAKRKETEKARQEAEAEAKRKEKQIMGLYSMQFSAWDLGCDQTGAQMYCGILRLNASQKSILGGFDKLMGGTGIFAVNSHLKARSDKNHAEIFLDLQLNKTNIRVDELGIDFLETNDNDWELYLIPKLDYKSLDHLPSQDRTPDVANLSFQAHGLSPVISCNLISIEQKKEAIKLNKDLTFDIIGDFIGKTGDILHKFNNCRFFERKLY